jgi:hypothetical protein
MATSEKKTPSALDEKVKSLAGAKASLDALVASKQPGPAVSMPKPVGPQRVAVGPPPGPSRPPPPHVPNHGPFGPGYNQYNQVSAVGAFTQFKLRCAAAPWSHPPRPACARAQRLLEPGAAERRPRCEGAALGAQGLPTVCDACGQGGKGFAYHCVPCEYDMHPGCALELKVRANLPVSCRWFLSIVSG